MIDLDITTCTGEQCPLADRCYRHFLYSKKNVSNQPGLVSVFTDVPYDHEKESCEFFMETVDIG